MCPAVSSATTLAQVACKMLWADMFFSKGHLEKAGAPADVAEALTSVSAACLDERWNLERATERLSSIWSRYDGAACVLQSPNQTVAAVTAAFILRRDTSEQKCERRYC